MTDVSEFRAVPAAVPQAISCLGRLEQQEFASVSAVAVGHVPGEPEEKTCSAEAPVARGVRKDHLSSSNEW